MASYHLVIPIEDWVYLSAYKYVLVEAVIEAIVTEDSRIVDDTIDSIMIGAHEQTEKYRGHLRQAMSADTDYLYKNLKTIFQTESVRDEFEEYADVTIEGFDDDTIIVKLLRGVPYIEYRP